jgi:hypothetical protein
MAVTPKHPSTRRRTNKVAGARTLTVVHDVDAPTLPDLVDGWHPQTLLWWSDVWASPMAPEYDSSDLHGLFLLARLVEPPGGLNRKRRSRTSWARSACSGSASGFHQSTDVVSSGRSTGVRKRSRRLISAAPRGGPGSSRKTRDACWHDHARCPRRGRGALADSWP